MTDKSLELELLRLMRNVQVLTALISREEGLKLRTEEYNTTNIAPQGSNKSTKEEKSSTIRLKGLNKTIAKAIALLEAAKTEATKREHFLSIATKIIGVINEAINDNQKKF